jgi:hypothetical protein
VRASSRQRSTGEACACVAIKAARDQFAAAVAADSTTPLCERVRFERTVCLRHASFTSIFPKFSP